MSLCPFPPASPPVSLPATLEFLRQLTFPKKLGILERLYGARLVRLGTTWVRMVNGTLWPLDLSDPLHRWMVYGDFEGGDFLTWARKWLKQGGWMVDSGAGMGEMVAYLAPLPGVRVLAIDPIPHNVAWLHRGIAANPGWDVQVIPEGLFSSRQVLEFQIDGSRSTCQQGWYRGKGLHCLQVPVGPLDDHLERLSWPRIRLWLLDVQGAELEVLRGASRALSERRIEAIRVWNILPENVAEVMGILGGYEYRFFKVLSRGRLQPVTDPDPSNRQFIAIRLA